MTSPMKSLGGCDRSTETKRRDRHLTTPTMGNEDSRDRIELPAVMGGQDVLCANAIDGG